MDKRLEERFLDYIRGQELFDPEDQLLLACSGGLDSMLLARLLLEHGFKFSVAHANFQLRGEDSNLDEMLVEEFCRQNGLSFFVKKFNKEESKVKGESIQMWARRVRYDWFHELLMEHEIKFLLTAHHADDSLETFMMQFLRGLSPFTFPGIRNKRDYIRRPFLFAKKTELLETAQSKKLVWREDKSNSENDYERNKMRNAILPLLKQYRGDSEEQLFGLLEEMQQKHFVWMKAFDEFAAKISWKKKEDTQILNFAEHKQNRMLFWYLYSTLIPVGFQSSQVEDIFKGIGDQKSGLLFYAAEFELLLDREQLILRKKTEEKSEAVLEISGPGEYEYEGLKISCKMVNETPTFPLAENCLYLEKSKFNFPFFVRRPQAGERMQPFGLKGTKKISDILVDKKVDRFAKEKIFLLTTAEDKIVWMIGFQKSELTRTTAESCESLKMEIW